LPLTTCPAIDAAPKGTQLPVVPKFKGDLTTRYTFPLMGEWQGHIQGAFTYQSQSTSELAPEQAAIIGSQGAYGLVDVLVGAGTDRLNVELFVDNAFDRRADLYRFGECTLFVGNTPVCAAHPNVDINKPRTIGVRFGQKF
jgi:outer membrane receptor protein involved in Fe transport